MGRKVVDCTVVSDIGQSDSSISNEKGQEKKSKVVWANTVKRRKIDWLWYPYIPKEKLTIFEGEPGQGKSYIMLTTAAAISVGHGLPNMARRAPGRTIIFSAEDGMADTLCPRLDKLKELGVEIDQTKIGFYPDALIFDKGGRRELEFEFSTCRPDLVVVDPLIAYTNAAMDINRANETREMMSMLKGLAEDFNFSWVLLRHFRKSSTQKAINRGMGSIDFAAAARSMLSVKPTPRTGYYQFEQVKSNVGPIGNTLDYRLDEAGYFHWISKGDENGA